MRFDPPLTTGVLIQRYKRFLADVRLDNGEVLTAHVANTGAMTGMKAPGSRVALSYHPNRGRKHPWSLQLVEVTDTWVCVNTSLANGIVEEAILGGHIPQLAGYGSLQREVPYGENSRIDLLLTEADRRCYVEVKNVTLVEEAVALFPDAVTPRGAKHLRALAAMVKKGHRAVAFYLINRSDCHLFRPASQVDPAYAKELQTAMGVGVEAMAFRTEATLQGIAVVGEAAVEVPGELETASIR